MLKILLFIPDELSVAVEPAVVVHDDAIVIDKEPRVGRQILGPDCTIQEFSVFCNLSLARTGLLFVVRRRWRHPIISIISISME